MRYMKTGRPRHRSAARFAQARRAISAGSVSAFATRPRAEPCAPAQGQMRIAILDETQRDTGEQGREHSPYAKANFQFGRVVMGWRATLELFRVKPARKIDASIYSTRLLKHPL
jgi:hypothetical protein